MRQHLLLLLGKAPIATDNCGIATIHLVSDVPTTPSVCGAYDEVRTWNFTDGNGNTSASFVQTIHVVASAPPITACPRIKLFCQVAGDSYTIPALQLVQHVVVSQFPLSSIIVVQLSARAQVMMQAARSLQVHRPFHGRCRRLRSFLRCVRHHCCECAFNNSIGWSWRPNFRCRFNNSYLWR
jgi:hypothetical protein